MTGVQTCALPIYGGILSAKNIDFTGSDFADFLTVAPRGAGTDPIDLGNGADTIVYNLGTPFESATMAKSTVKLGSNDGAKDTVNVAGTGTGTNNQGTIITVQDFVFGQDVVNSIKADESLISYAVFADKSAMENVIKTGFSESSVTLTSISTDGTLGFVQNGTGSSDSRRPEPRFRARGPGCSIPGFDSSGRGWSRGTAFQTARPPGLCGPPEPPR